MKVELRQFRPDDASEVARLVGDELVSRWTTSIPHPYSGQDAVRWIEETSSNRLRRPFAVELEGRLVACVSYWPYEAKDVEVGYWVGRKFWGQGVGTSALSALIARSDFPSESDIFAKVMIDNIGSQRVLEKSGFAFLRSDVCTKNDCEVPAKLYVRRSSA